MNQMQQQLAMLMNGSADRTPRTAPPRRAGCSLLGPISKTSGYRRRAPDVRPCFCSACLQSVARRLQPDLRAPGLALARSVVVFASQVRDQFLAQQISQRVLQLHQLNEQIVLRVERRGMLRTLEVKGQPLLNAEEAGTLRKIEKQRHVEHDRRRQNAVPAQEVHLELHLVPEPAHEIDVV